MLSRLFAVWLLTLIVLPFTAPFSTCDVAVARSRSHVRSLAQTAAASHALPASRPGLRVKLAVSAPSAPVELTPPPARRQVRIDVAGSELFFAPFSPPLRL
jgi:hypothetical protein